jgi:hypothetical protein
MIREKLGLLNQKKQHLVEIEDFDRAKDLKLVIDKIKIIGAQIAKLEFQKRQSIDAEDYDTSKVLKFEIDRLKDAAFLFDTDRLLSPISQGYSEGYPQGYQKMSGEIIETEAELIERSIRDLQEIEEADNEEEVRPFLMMFYSLCINVRGQIVQMIGLSNQQLLIYVCFFLMIL